MAAPPRTSISSRAARYILLPAFSAAHRVAMAAPPRVRFAALYLLLAALWLANANTIAKIFERCARLDCFLSDIECRICLEFTGSIGFMSLLLLRVHWQRFSEACEAAAGAQDDPPPAGPALEVEPGHPYPPAGETNHQNDLDLDILFLVNYSTPFAVFGLLGMMYRLPAPRMGSDGVIFANILAKVGFLTTACSCCLLVIPCIVLRLRRFHMEKDEGAAAA